MIYGITGKKQHGKDTLAKAFQLENPKVRIIHFADHLKNLAQKIWGLSHAQVHVDKETSFINEGQLEYIVMDNFIDDMSDFTGLKIIPAGKLARTPRELMQYFGAEYVRQADENYWVDYAMGIATRFVHKGKIVVIPDARFSNEFLAIRRENGQIIRVVRKDAPKSEIGVNHSSELEMDSLEANHTFYIDNGDLLRFNEIAKGFVHAK